MPRSSGGGSHRSSSSHSSGGGSHRSSSSYSGSSGGSSHSYTRNRPTQRTSTVYFTGADKYVYYEGMKPHYVYSNYASVQNSKHFGRLLVYVPIILLLLYTTFFYTGAPDKLNGDYPHDIIVEDAIGCLGNTDGLEKSLAEFYEKTGIAAAVITAANETWQPYYSDLSSFAYDLYVNRFEDENHWLIVYTEPRDPSPEFIDWYWEGMQGDNTTSILTTSVTDAFNANLTKALTTRSRYSVGQAVAYAFDTMTPTIMNPIEKDAYFYVVGIVISLGIVFLALVRVGVFKKKVKAPKDFPSEAKKCATDAKEISCQYCNGIYLNDRFVCPYCGAPRKAAENTQ